jgi:glycine/D-amino acid oxidase-like deaminating enzyme
MIPVWRTDDGPTFSPLASHATADLCVVGLGASGLAAMTEAERLGRTAIGIDAGDVGCGAAGRNGGFLLAGLADFHHDAVAAIGRERAVAIYRLTLAELAVADYRRVGSLRIADDDAERADCERMLDALRADGFDAEPYEGVEGVGVLLPHDGAFDPLARCRSMAMGLTIHEQTPAVDITGHRVTTPDGIIECGAVVVAVDGGLEQVLPELVGRVQSARLQMLATEPVEPRFTRPVYTRWGYDYWQQLASGAIALGGCRDRFTDGEWTRQATPTGPVQACLDRLLHDRLRVDATVTHRWAGIVGYTQDRMPVCEEVRPGVFAVGGYCGTGNVIGPLCARAVTRLALGEPAGDLGPLLSA